MWDFIKTTIELLASWLGRRRNAKDEYFCVIDEQRAKLEVIDRTNRLAPVTEPNTNEDVFFEESIPILISAVRKVQRFLPKRQRHRAGEVLEEYKSYKTKYKGLTRKAVDARDGNSYSKTLHEFLDKFETSVK